MVRTKEILVVAAALAVAASVGLQARKSDARAGLGRIVLTGPRIVYEHVTFTGGVKELWTMKIDGSEKTKIPLPPGSGSHYLRRDPSASPDGRKIAFAGIRNGVLEIGTMNWDGSDLKYLTESGPNDQPAWSPDGTKIAFSHETTTGLDLPGIYVMNADGSDIRRVPSTIRSRFPAWTPDSSSILYTEIVPDSGLNTGKIYRHVLGSPEKPAELVYLSAAIGTRAAPSPDGTRLAVTRLGVDELWVINVSGRPQKGYPLRLTIHGAGDAGVRDINPSWSPDGKRIVFERYRPAHQFVPESWSLWIVDAERGYSVPMQTVASIASDARSFNYNPHWANNSSLPLPAGNP